MLFLFRFYVNNWHFQKRICLYVNPVSENRGRRKVKRNFSIVKMDRFRRFWHVRTQKICEILLVIIQNFRNENSGCQLTLDTNAVWNFCSKVEKISDMDWAQHIKMDYAKNFRKYPVHIGQKRPTKFFIGCYLPILQFYRTGNWQQFCLNCSKLYPFLRTFWHLGYCKW